MGSLKNRFVSENGKYSFFIATPPKFSWLEEFKERALTILSGIDFDSHPVNMLNQCFVI